MISAKNSNGYEGSLEDDIRKECGHTVSVTSLGDGSIVIRGKIQDALDPLNRLLSAKGFTNIEVQI